MAFWPAKWYSPWLLSTLPLGKKKKRMTTSISSEARRNRTSILIRGRKKSRFHRKGTDRQKYGRTDISIYRLASLLKKIYLSDVICLSH